MHESSRSFFLWLGLFVAILMGALWQFVPLNDAKTRIASLPLAGPSFVGQNIPLSTWEVDFFKNVNVMKRIYQIGKKTLFITALDGTHNRHAVHDPLYCFRGSGYEVVSQQSLALPDGGSVALVKLLKDGKEQDAMYWFTNGSKPYDRPIKYWWQATLRRLTFGLSGQEPILIVVQPIDDAPLDWKQVVHFFPQLLTL